MNKVDICIVQTGNVGYLENIKYLDFNKFVVRFAILDIDQEQTVNLEFQGQKLNFIAYPFFSIDKAIFSMGNADTKYFLFGFKSDLSDTLKMRRILQSYGVSKDKVYNFTFWEEGLIQYMHILKYALEEKLDFFSTGISYIQDGLDMEAFSNLKGVNLAQSGQDIFYSYKMAEGMLSQNRGTYKFALIGLAPYSFDYDSSLAFSSSFYPLYYYPIFRDFKDSYMGKDLMKNLLNDQMYDHLMQNSDAMKADLNRMFIKNSYMNASFSRDMALSVENEAESLNNKNYPETVSENINLLHRYVRLLKEYNITPVFCILPFSKLLRKFYEKEKISCFRNIIKKFKEQYAIEVIDFWDADIENKYFYNLSHLNKDGSTLISKMIYERINHLKNR